MKTFFASTVLAMTIVVSPLVNTVVAQEPAAWAKANMDALVDLYKYFHAHPELSFMEEQTAARMASEFEDLGATVKRRVGGHGVVGVLKNGTGKTLLLRADMDALPIVEDTGLPFASTVRMKDEQGKDVGVMHACGHDIHMTNLIGTARYLAENKKRWKGTLILIAQPAEERGSGAIAMINDGLFKQFPKPDFCLGIHVASNIPAGKVAVRGGYTMANVDSVDVTLFGRGGHGAYPHTTIDPVVQAARFVMDVQSIVSREVKPVEPAVITVGSIHAGTKHNIISDECHLQLTVRSYSDEVRQQLIDAIKRKAKAAAQSMGADEPKIVVSEGTPSLFNSPDMVDVLVPVFQRAIGENNVVPAEQVMGAEDFSQYSRQGGMPGLLYWIGSVEARRLQRYDEMGLPIPSLHSSSYYPDFVPALTTGITTMSSAAMELLKRP